MYAEAGQKRKEKKNNNNYNHFSGSKNVKTTCTVTEMLKEMHRKSCLCKSKAL